MSGPQPGHRAAPDQALQVVSRQKWKANGYTIGFKVNPGSS
jgi:hypothetical protein